ncbi:MAG: sigma-54-dependent Fis family transcriptional regulator, partial [Acidobacteriota bacterium]
EPIDIGKQFLAKLSEEVPHTGANLFLLSESEQFSLLHSSGSCRRTGRRLLKQLPTVILGTIITERLDGIASAGVPLWTGAIPMGMIYVERMKSEFTEFEVDYMGVMTLMAQLSVNHRRSRTPFPQAPVGDSIRLGKGERIVGEHPSWLFVLDQVRKVAPTRATVLITGESGTGKELIARAIHQLSNRADQRYFAVNCATVGEDLVENELFGHIKGSYTGANDSRGGMFEVTTNGTLLLDEISTMPLQIQAHLLRVLDTKTVRRIGGTREISVDTRVVAATNEDLKALVAAKRFRHDLYHRLNVVQINLPPLRERSSDIPMLCHYFLSILSRENGRSVRIRSDAVKLLEGYPFPGNVRELRNLLERLYHGTKAQEITADTINSRTGIQRVNPRRSSYQVDTRWDLMVSQGVSFDTAVKEPYLAREICTDDVIQIITRGLIATGGNYRKLTELFNIPPGGYRSFLRFLSTHGCKVDFRPFRKKETMK